IAHYAVARVMKEEHLLGHGFKIDSALLLQLAHPERSYGFVVASFVVVGTEAPQPGTHPVEGDVVAVELQVRPGHFEMLAMAKLLQPILAALKTANFVEKQL